MIELKTCLQHGLGGPLFVTLCVGALAVAGFLLWEIFYLRRMIRVEQAIYEANHDDAPQ